MGFCQKLPEQTRHDDPGYATPAALAVSLALALTATALLARAMGDLRTAQAEFRNAQVEMALAGAQVLAASAVVSSRREGPYAWSETSDLGRVWIFAEEEAPKMAANAASRLPDEALLAFGVKDLGRLRARLADATTRGSTMVEDLDEAPLWRFCAPWTISVLGEGETFNPVSPAEPGAGPNPQSWRIGEVWRVSVATPDGWRDNRLVRFTGDAHRPAATLARRFFKTSGSGELQVCEELLSGLAGG